MRLSVFSAAACALAFTTMLCAQDAVSRQPVLYRTPLSVSQFKSLGEIRRLQRGTQAVIRTSDSAGHLVKVTEPDADGKPALVTDITYNQTGRVTKIVQHGREGDIARVRSFTYDEKGRVVSATSPEAGIVTYTYDADGNLGSKKDALGQTVTYAWDKKKRLVSKTFSDGTASSHLTYDEATKDYSSFLTVAGMHEATRSYHYDSKGRLTRLSMATPDEHSSTYTLGFHYDDARGVKTIIYPDGTEIQQAFNSAGLLKSVRQGKSVLFSKPEYLVPSGRLKAVTLGNGITLKREYDKHNRVQHLVISSSTAGTLLDELFAYTEWGSVQRLTDNLNPSGDIRFGYDELQRVKRTEGAADETYIYDGFGNQAQTIGGAANRVFDGHNRIVGGEGISYDAAGEITNDGLHSYRYDGNGLITTVDGGRIRYFYDGEGNRVRKRLPNGNHDYLWWNDQLLAERAPDGTWTNYVYVNGGRFASLRKTGAQADEAVEISYLITSALGTNRMKLSSAGTVLERGSFAPFGTPLSSASAQAMDVSFSDEVHDEETGLDTYRFRSYNPRLGRWMSPDPSSLHFASLGNPQTYNLYSFVTDDPLKYIDVHGLYADNPCVNQGDDDDGNSNDDGNGNGCTAPPGDGADGGNGGGGGNDPCPPDTCTTVTTTPDPPVDPDPVDSYNGLFDGSCDYECIVSYPAPTDDDSDQSTLQQREAAAEKAAMRNMQNYFKNNPSLAAETQGMRIFPECQSGNHDCQYVVDGMTSVTYYVWEHQTSPITGGQQVGVSDYITPNSSTPPNSGAFYDSLGGSSLDSYRFFTISQSSTYNSSEQVPILIQEGGQTIGFEHIYSTGGDVQINGSTKASR